MKSFNIFGESIIDNKTIAQFKNCFLEDSIGSLSADAHYGYSMPIGGAIGYKNHISLSGVGYDVGCGNNAVRTEMKFTDINISKVMDEVQRRVSFGVGRKNNEPVHATVLDTIANHQLKHVRDLASLAADQLGTVGSGNHFVDLFKDDEGYIWIANHFGSRGFGHKIASGYMAMAAGKNWGDKHNAGSMDSKPVLLEASSQLGQEYYELMNIAGEYAKMGRTIVINKVLEILDNPHVTFNVNNHHNFAWYEEHFGEMYYVARKGCTPAFPDQYGFIGSNMADKSVIVKGLDSELSAKGLYSTVHGAGRVMSRTQAAGKKKWIKDPVTGRKSPVVVAAGCVNFAETQERMKSINVELRGAGADESPQCYKKLPEVLEAQGVGETIQIEYELTPIGICMAGEEFDPYKD